MAQICTKTATSPATPHTTGYIYIEYSIQNTATAATVTVQPAVKAVGHGGGGVYSDGAQLGLGVNGTIVTQGVYIPTTYATTAGNVQTFGTAYSTTITKSHSAKSIPIVVTAKGSWSITHLCVSTHMTGGGTSTYKYGAPFNSTTLTEYIPISAQTSYTITFNINGGTGTVPSQTKWHGETMTIQSTTPTMDGYTFKGWATSVDRASAGTVDYTIGSTYPATNNSDATLYAVWELTYIAPKIQNVSIERCNQDGSTNDEGEYAVATFDWSIYQSSLPQYYGGTDAPYTNNTVKENGCVLTIENKQATKTLTGTSGIEEFIVVGNGLSTDTSYSAILSITDMTNHTTIYTGSLSTTYFPMDFNRLATAVGFFMPAPDGGNGAYFGKDVNIYVDASKDEIDAQITQGLAALGWNVLS